MARHRLCVGVDIGSSAVKLCQLRAAGAQMRLVSYGYAAVPPDSVVDGAVMNAGNLVEVVRELVRAHEVRETRVALSISGNAVTIKNVVMPKMARRELEASLQFEAEQHIPFAIKDVFLDVQILGPARSDPTQLDVLLVAAKKDFVNEYTAVLNEAGLTPVVCDVDPFAVQTAYAHNYGPVDGQTTALVHVGAAKTSINVLAAGHSRFTRDLSLGGNNFTAEIARSLAVSFADAENIKLGQHVPYVPPVQAAIDGVLQTLTDEIAHTCDYFAAANEFGPPQRIYLSGGTAAMPGLLGAIGRKVAATCEPLDPWRKVAVPPDVRTYVDGHGGSASVAVGLAMRYMGDC